MATFPCVVLTGARQSGKTTLLKQCYPDYRFVSLDLPSLAEKAEKEPSQFLKEYAPPLVIDEVQYAPALFRYLKIKIDEDRHKMGQYVLTGSQKFTLMKEVSESLAGRASILNLETLSIAELPKKLTGDPSVLIARGLYPELWRQPDLNPPDFYGSYLATYLERDVRQILNVHSLRDFERFLRSCATRSAQLLNLSDLARDVGIKPQTAKDWLNVLEASNQISLLEPYFENIGKRIVKSPKLFLNDPGMLCFLMGLDSKSLSNNPLAGNVWETFVYSEFRKKIAAEMAPSTLWYYRDAQGKECDFLLVGGGKIDLFEVKWSESADPRWLDNLGEIAKNLARSKTQEIGNSYLLYRGETEKKARETTYITNPAQYFGAD